MSDYVYDAEYYAKHLGPIPCSFKSSEWRGLFKQVAERIIKDYKPKSVIDAGCAIGLLVRSLRDLKVPTLGFDFSEYAIKTAHQNKLYPYCQRYSLPYFNRWSAELVSCVEVVEHIPEDLAFQSIRNLCLMSGRYILFSSSPDDFEEPSHCNVQPEEYWLEMFTECGFKKIATAPWLSKQAIVLEGSMVKFQ